MRTTAPSLRAGALLLALCAPLVAQEQRGYRLEGSQVVVERPGHWQVWEGAIGAYLVEADGTVRPRFLRRNQNAVLDAPQFETGIADNDTLRGGIRAAGSNLQDAALVMDGDPGTWWEPDRRDVLEQWFIEIELGRTVIARQVALRFAPEGAGDPFLKFRVLVSDGREGFGTQKRLEYFRAGQLTLPNKDQREFVFNLKPRRPLPEGVSGEPVQILRFEALETDGPRGRRVTPEEYQALGSEDQGVIDYFRRTTLGRQLLIDQESYEALPDSERGELHYYRHERPCLAEVEVHTPGDNIVNLTQRLRNQDLDLFANLLRIVATDGFFRSFYPIRTYDPLQNKNQLEIDLGAKFWLDRIRLLSADTPINAYQLRVSDGSLDPAGTRIWRSFEERLNRQGFLQLEEQFPLQEVRFIELRRLELVGATQERSEVSEVQAYGEGYVSEVVLSSPLISLGRTRIFTGVSWEGEALPGTRIEVRTRSGDEVVQIKRYFDVADREITREQWEAIREQNRGPVIEDQIPGADWSNWSEIYQSSGEQFRSPSPRQYAQVQARLLTEDPQRAATLSALRLGLAPPLVDQVLAEIWPVRGVQPGQDQEFTLYLQPRFGVRNSGFDRIILGSSSSAPIELLSLRAGQDAQLRGGGGRSLWPGEVEVQSQEDGSLALIFPQPVIGGSQVYAARFRTQVFLSGTTFNARLSNQSRPGVVQSASEGDASVQSASQSLVVIADLERASLLGAVEVRPPVFTPNGDGINDQAQIRFAIYRLRGARLLRVGIYDLQGRRLRDLSVQRENPSGEHTLEWDGRDDAGTLVAPGIYLVRVGFSTDTGAAGTEALRLVRVVY